MSQICAELAGGSFLRDILMMDMMSWSETSNYSFKRAVTVALTFKTYYFSRIEKLILQIAVSVVGWNRLTT